MNYKIYADPTRDEMLEALKGVYDSYAGEYSKDEMEFDVEAAVYWFASEFHGGQGSNLYSALSNSPYRPGAIETRKTCLEGSYVCDELYETLMQRFVLNRGE